MFKKYSLRLLIISSFVFLAIGFAVGYVVKPAQVITTKAIRENNTKYHFIHPLLAVGRTTNTPTPQYKNVVSQVNQIFKDGISQKKIDSASLYFIDYSGGGSFAINENEAYDPAKHAQGGDHGRIFKKVRG